MMQTLTLLPTIGVRPQRTLRATSVTPRVSDLCDQLARLGLTVLSAGYDSQSGSVRVELLGTDGATNEAALAAQRTVEQWMASGPRGGEVQIEHVAREIAFA